MATRNLLSSGVDVHEGIATISIGSGRRRNALGMAEWTHLGKVADLVSADGDVRAVVIRGAGETFCAGFDLREWETVGLDDIGVAFETMECVFKAIERIPVPVVAEIRGTAAGAGCQIALSCDIRVMAETARIGMPTGQLGINPCPEFVGRVACAAGLEVAADLFFTGRLLDGREAAARGLVARCISDEGLSSATAELVALIASRPPSPLRRAKSLMHSKKCEFVGIEPSFANESQAVEFDAFRTGVRNFLAK